MKKVPTYLLDMLLAASESQTVAPFDTATVVHTKIDKIDNNSVDFDVDESYNPCETGRCFYCPDRASCVAWNYFCQWRDYI